MRALAPHRALSASGVSSIVVRAADRAGLERVGAHRLRHTAATELLRSGAALPEGGAKFGKSRELPLDPSALGALRRYLDRVDRPSSDSDP